jgi:hypothetical protein
MMELVEFKEEEHYEMLVGWWESHGWGGVDASVLKPIAYLVKHDDEFVLFGVLWPICETGVCLMEWIVSNPEAKPMTVFRCLKTLTGFYEGVCRDNDFGMLFTTCKQDGLAKVHERNGFERCDEGMIHLAKTID